MRSLGDRAMRRLLILGNGAIVVTPRKTWAPLLSRGWVEQAWEVMHRDAEAARRDAGHLPPLRITPAGLRALADWLERTGPLPLPKREEP